MNLCTSGVGSDSGDTSPSHTLPVILVASLDGLRPFHVSVVSRQVQCTEKDRPGVAAAEWSQAENLMISCDIQDFHGFSDLLRSVDICGKLGHFKKLIFKRSAGVIPQGHGLVMLPVSLCPPI